MFKHNAHPLKHKHYKTHRRDGGHANNAVRRKKKASTISSAIGTLKGHLVNRKKHRVKTSAHNSKIRSMDSALQAPVKEHSVKKPNFQDKLRAKEATLMSQDATRKDRYDAFQKKSKIKMAHDYEKLADKSMLKDVGGLGSMIKGLYGGLDERLRSDMDKHNVLGLIDPFVIVGLPIILFLLYRYM